jgi:hypothetical protein
MKKILFILAFIPCVLFSQTIKKDSVFLDQKYVGVIKKIGYVDSSLGFKNDNMETSNSVRYLKYDFYLDEFVSPAELGKIKFYLENRIEHLNKTKKDIYITVDYKERFINKTPSQISGYYLLQAGQLKNKRNNWRLIGGGVATAIVLIFPPSTPVILIAGGVGACSSIASITLDYKSNDCLKKAGNALMK